MVGDYRCYAREESLYPDKYQFCGELRSDGRVYPVSPTLCGKDGCPGKTPRPPYRIVDVSDMYRKSPDSFKAFLILLIVLSTLFMA